MKTLGKSITSKFYNDVDGYAKVELAWRNSKSEKNCMDHIVYAILRGKDWTKGITPLTNQKRIETQTPSWSDNREYYLIVARLEYQNSKFLNEIEHLLVDRPKFGKFTRKLTEGIWGYPQEFVESYYA